MPGHVPGAGAVLLNHVLRTALQRGLRPMAWYVPTSVNRVMLVTLRFAGFEPAERHGDRMLLAFDDHRPPADPPAHLHVITDHGASS